MYSLQLNLLAEDIEYRQKLETPRPTFIHTRDPSADLPEPTPPAPPPPKSDPWSFANFFNAPAVGGMTGAAMTAFPSSMLPPTLPRAAYRGGGRMPSAGFNTLINQDKAGHKPPSTATERDDAEDRWSNEDGPQVPRDYDHLATWVPVVRRDQWSVVPHRNRKEEPSTWSAALSNRPAVEIA